MALWPDGKTFAFTVFDDTDNESVGNFESVYGLLRDLGLRTTKSVWPLEGPQKPKIGGATCQDPEYLRVVLQLQKEGFEIGSHGTSFHGMRRQDTIRGLEMFRDLFGSYPAVLANHADATDAMYWGEARLDGPYRLAYRALTRDRHRGEFQGHVPSSPFFWGDHCAAKVRYVRNFTTPHTNTLRACPYMPYHDSRRPYVAAWFSSTNGPRLEPFVNALHEREQDRLEADGGACVMYTHFASGFQDGGAVNSRFQFLMTRLSRKNGWFVPVSVILDHLASRNGVHQISDAERSALQRAWLTHKIVLRGTS